MTKAGTFNLFIYLNYNRLFVYIETARLLFDYRCSLTRRRLAFITAFEKGRGGSAK